MRALMARLRGARTDATPPLPLPASNIEAAPAAAEVAFDTNSAAVHVPAWAGPIPPLSLSYTDAVCEALDQVTNLGLDRDLDLPRDVAVDLADVVRYVYAQGWLACETRLASPNMADQIDLAITTPAAVVDRRPGESDHGWTIHAIQQTVAFGVKSGQT